MTDEPRNEFVEILQALQSGAVLPDGRPITPSTVGELMAEHADQLEAEFGEAQK